jgi:hypothetical protein
MTRGNVATLSEVVVSIKMREHYGVAVPMRNK